MFIYVCLDAMLLPVLLVTNLAEGADVIGGQLHGDKMCPLKCAPSVV